jgi:MFS family permease
MGITRNMSMQKEKLWNWNFFLLWQGQLVSALGDVVYSIALGFWVLKVTGSTALMGTLMAASVLPRVIISPFAGVLVDRSDRKRLLVLMDLIRGIFVVFVGIGAYMGFIEIWMVFTAAVILGICGAFFNPAAMSVLPDIVPKSKIIKANSAFSMAYTGTNIFGNVAGGSLYAFLGAPFMFLFNGISYLFSAFTETFIRVPKIRKESEEVHFFTDMKEGFVFVWNFKGLRWLITIAAFLNFFGNMGIILILPMFEQIEWLGPTNYGIAMGFMAGGSFLGMLYTSIKDIAPEKRFKVFIISAVLSEICFAIFPFNSTLLPILILLFIAGFFNAIINVFFSSSVQLTVPQNMRGKVNSLLGTVLMGLTPIAMALGGIIAEFIPIKIIISTCFIFSFIFFIPLAFIPSFKRFINFNPETQTLEDIM